MGVKLIEQPKSYLKILALLYDTEGIPIDNKQKIEMDSLYLSNLAKLSQSAKTEKGILTRAKSFFSKK